MKFDDNIKGYLLHWWLNLFQINYLQDYTAGLSWKEEKELKKAIHASLQESKHPSKSPDEGMSSHDGHEYGQSGSCAKQKGLMLKMPDSSKQQASGSGSPNKRLDFIWN